MTGIHHVAIDAADFDATKRFYTAGLGFHVSYEWVTSRGRAAMLGGDDGTHIEVFDIPGRPLPADGAITHFALRTDDVDAAYATALAAGGVAHTEPRDYAYAGSSQPPVRLAFCRGLDGELIEFLQGSGPGSSPTQ
ncbi:MAG: hypothetical protein NVSMB17_01000 [Candidatus Dormibacteria bacterium]